MARPRRPSSVLVVALGATLVVACSPSDTEPEPGTTADAGATTSPTPATSPTTSPADAAWDDLLAARSADDVHAELRTAGERTPAISFAAAVRADGTEEMRAEVPVDVPSALLRVTCVAAREPDTSTSPVTVELLADDTVVATHVAPCGGVAGGGVSSVTTESDAVDLPAHDVTTLRVRTDVDVVVAAGLVDAA